MASLIKSLKLPASPLNGKLRVMTEEDVPGVHRLLTTYLAERCAILVTSDAVYLSVSTTVCMGE